MGWSHGVVAFVFAGGVVAGGLALDGGLGVRTPPPAPTSTTNSGAWLCPHGGGTGWEGRIYLANPGTTASTVRVRSLTGKGSTVVATVRVDPGTTTEVDVPATARESSTAVEYFGGWVAAGWMTVSLGTAGTGVGAEPCIASTDASTWYTANDSTPKGSGANLIIMNPYGKNAIFDVVLFAADRAPVHESDLTDIVLKPYRSMIVPIAPILPLEAAVGAEVDVHAGRVGVASVDTTAQGGIGAVIGSTTTMTSGTVPLLGGNGQRALSLIVPGEDPVRFDGSIFSENASQPAPSLSDVAQDPQTSQSYLLATSGASALRVVEQQGSPGEFVVSVFSLGEGTDLSATAGAAPAERWVVLPTVADDPSTPALVITNPGTVAASVTLHALSANGPADITIEVPAGSSMEAPVKFLAADTHAGILVTAETGRIIATGASESLGLKGIAGYALAVGIPVPNVPSR